MESLAELTRDMLDLCKTSEEAERLLELNRDNISLVTKRLLTCEGTVGQKRHLETVLGDLKGLQSQIASRVKTGRGLIEERPSIEWHDVSDELLNAIVIYFIYYYY